MPAPDSFESPDSSAGGLVFAERPDGEVLFPRSVTAFFSFCCFFFAGFGHAGTGPSSTPPGGWRSSSSATSKELRRAASFLPSRPDMARAEAPADPLCFLELAAKQGLHAPAVSKRAKHPHREAPQTQVHNVNNTHERLFAFR